MARRGNGNRRGGGRRGGNNNNRGRQLQIRAAQQRAAQQRAAQQRAAAQRKAQQAAARRAAQRKAQQEAKRKAQLEAKRKAKLEAQRKAKLEAKRKAERQAQRQAERKAQQEAQRKAELKAKRQAEKEAKEKAKRQAQRKAERQENKQGNRNASTRKSDNKGKKLGAKDLKAMLKGFLDDGKLSGKEAAKLKKAGAKPKQLQKQLDKFTKKGVLDKVGGNALNKLNKLGITVDNLGDTGDTTKPGDDEDIDLNENTPDDLDIYGDGPEGLEDYDKNNVFSSDNLDEIEDYWNDSDRDLDQDEFDALTSRMDIPIEYGDGLGGQFMRKQAKDAKNGTTNAKDFIKTLKAPLDNKIKSGIQNDKYNVFAQKQDGGFKINYPTKKSIDSTKNAGLLKWAGNQKGKAMDTSSQMGETFKKKYPKESRRSEDSIKQSIYNDVGVIDSNPPNNYKPSTPLKVSSSVGKPMKISLK